MKQAEQSKSKSILIVTAVEGAENLGAVLSREANVTVQVARSRRSALAVLRREEFTLVLLDLAMPGGAHDVVEGEIDTIWQRSGLAVPMELNLASVGAARLVRLVRGILARREQETLLARRVARTAIEEELRSQVTGLLLQSELILRETSIPEPMREKLTALRELADELRVRLQRESATSLIV